MLGEPRVPQHRSAGCVEWGSQLALHLPGSLCHLLQERGSVRRPWATPVVLRVPESGAVRGLIWTTGRLLILGSLSHGWGRPWARRPPVVPCEISWISTTWPLKLRSLWDPVLLLSNLTSLALRSMASAAVAASVTALMSGLAAPFHGSPTRVGHAGCLGTPLSFSCLDLDCFSLSHTAQVFPWVVLDDGSLMYKYIFSGVIPTCKSIPICEVEAFDSSKDFGGKNFFLGVFTDS